MAQACRPNSHWLREAGPAAVIATVAASQKVSHSIGLERLTHAVSSSPSLHFRCHGSGPATHPDRSNMSKWCMTYCARDVSWTQIVAFAEYVPSWALAGSSVPHSAACLPKKETCVFLCLDTRRLNVQSLSRRPSICEDQREVRIFVGHPVSM